MASGQWELPRPGPHPSWAWTRPAWRKDDLRLKHWLREAAAASVLLGREAKDGQELEGGSGRQGQQQ